jgi:hypothetical protein
MDEVTQAQQQANAVGLARTLSQQDQYELIERFFQRPRLELIPTRLDPAGK